MNSTSEELDTEKLQDVSGGAGLLICHHTMLSEYLGKKKVENGTTLYAWKCARCRHVVWDPKDPNASVGVTGGW